MVGHFLSCLTPSGERGHGGVKNLSDCHMRANQEGQELLENILPEPTGLPWLSFIPNLPFTPQSVQKTTNQSVEETTTAQQSQTECEKTSEPGEEKRCPRKQKSAKCLQASVLCPIYLETQPADSDITLKVSSYNFIYLCLLRQIFSSNSFYAGVEVFYSS